MGTVRDLLSEHPSQPLQLKDHPHEGIYIKDVTTFTPNTAQEIRRVFALGLRNSSANPGNRKVEAPRAETIFTITVESCNSLGQICRGKLNVVECKGSERQSKTAGERLKDAARISLSLPALGNVVSALVDGKSSHIPYRDSKFTRLLQESLGGNAKTVWIANLNPADYSYDETLSTLRYAYRAKSIRNNPKINMSY